VEGPFDGSTLVKILRPDLGKVWQYRPSTRRILEGAWTQGEEAVPGYPPALLFRDIPGYPRDRRVLGALFSSPTRLALTLGLDEREISTKQEMVAACRKKLATVKLVPPVMVETGPVAENVLEGADVDLLAFPVPRHHELDGGRYIGTANCVSRAIPTTAG
jgi:UbiD family decarboxylase